jgi:DNA-binding CsgD family transcriptional regulator
MAVTKSSWGYPTSTTEAYRRASGRRAYNQFRQDQALLRPLEVYKLWALYGFHYGVKARIARELGIHRSTVTRDLRRAMKFELKELSAWIVGE